MKVFYTLIFTLLYTVSSFGNKDSLSLIIFLLDDCPICLQYTPTLNELHDQYKEDINFIGYFPNFSSKPEKIEAFKADYKINFPLYTDYFKQQAKKYNASITPEVILYNHTTNTIIYQGRIDNKFYSLGRRRNVVTEHDLKEAIESTLNGQLVKQRITEAVGCYINFSDNLSIKAKNGKN